MNDLDRDRPDHPPSPVPPSSPPIGVVSTGSPTTSRIVPRWYGAGRGLMVPEAFRREGPLFLSIFLVGAILGGLLVGYETVGGDPDRMYRPLKSELARALEHGRLPFWSDKFGVGLPLIAESHVAAFYPPNLILYRLLGVPAAYRLSMWLHYLAIAA